MKKIFLLIILIVFTSACSSTKRQGIFKKQEQKESTDKSIQRNILNANLDKTFDAILNGIKWVKWDVAFSNREEGTIILKEAYVYRKEGSLLRIYHWPEGQDLANSRIPDYISKVSTSKDRDLNNSISFTQEAMTINLSEISGGKTNVKFDYAIIPFTLSTTISSQVKSSGYIEKLILEKASKSL